MNFLGFRSVFFDFPARISSRVSIIALAGLLAAGCNEFKPLPDPKISALDSERLAQVAKFDGNAQFERYEVENKTGEGPGTIVVDTKERMLYLVQPGGKKAIRYGVATGSEAFGWTGTATVARMAEWPRWVPPKEMAERWPHLKPVIDAGGLDGGADNPLGARALYLYQGDRDTLYRIHGTNEPESIGSNASSGCIRMRNIDAIDLYNRTKVGTTVIVR